jgi:SHS2 domain-containing protein
VSWKLIEHTGDIGVVARTATLEGLFADCAEAMFSILAENDSPRPTGKETFPVSGEDPPEELRDFLSELLYRFSADRKMYGPFVAGKGSVEASFETYDPERHPLGTEIKAVTWHQLEAVREGHGWSARVIFDI